MSTGTERRVFINTELPDESKDKFGAQLFSYPKNKIKTSKYTILNFIPKNLWEQCRRIANLFFIFLILFQFVPVFQEMDPIWAIIPLAAVMFVTAMKDGYEDLKRHSMDTELNNSICYIPEQWDNLNYPSVKLSWKNYILSTVYWYFTKQYKPKIRRIKRYKNVKQSALSMAPIIGGEKKVMKERNDKGWRKILWKYVRVGDIVCIKNNEMLPADIAIISTCEKDNVCYAETKSLDGETSLKVRKGPKETAHISSVEEIVNFKGFIDAERPTAELQHFSGVLVVPSTDEKKNDTKEDLIYKEGEQSIPLNINNLLLRGSILRNTEWVIGIVLYTGCDTKVMLGSGKTPSKRSKIEKVMNPQVMFNFFILFALSLITSVAHYFYFSDWLEEDAPWINNQNGAIKSMIYALGNAVILLQTIIPISLYVTVEIVKMIQTFLISWDVDMYYDKSDEACMVKTWTISDDLGQIEYIFSDKTGTLTQNKMEFRRCSINGKVYGIKGTDVSLKDRDKELVKKQEGEAEIKMRNQMRSLFKNPYLNETTSLPFVDDTLFEDVMRNDAQSNYIKQFFTHVALCHTVLSPKSINPEQFEYGAESPDEQSLVSTAKDLGFIFLSRNQTHIYLNVLGEEIVYELLNIIEFNSTRKRMSVIIKDKEGTITLLCKGADNIIYERLKEKNNELSQITMTHLENFANEGLRTLCLAYKIIPQSEYDEWNAKYTEASKTIEKREEKMEAIAELIETDFVLLGTTAIEDRLQDGVPECIDTLLKAGIKVWVLTGDKFETAINIGFACNLLKKNMVLLMIRNPKGKNDTIEVQLQNAQSQLSSIRGSYGMIIEGMALRSVFENENNKDMFLNISTHCDAVICCRVAPKQKAEVVRLVKNKLKAMCLSIGDGANDVCMIQEANVGIGIAGEEGMQAAMSSDYVISQFRFLSKLLLVHGRWSYVRIANCVLNFFFKNIIWVFIMFWYQLFNGFSATNIYDYPLWMYYNILFTSIPVVVIGILDQDVNAETAMKIPQIYASTKKKQDLFTWKRFLVFVINAIYLSLVSFFIPLGMFVLGGLPGEYANDKQMIGHAMACYGIIVANLTSLNYMNSWYVSGTIVILLEALSYFIYIPFAKFFDAEAPDLSTLLAQPLFWLGLLLVVVMCYLPVIVIRFYNVLFNPSDLTIVKEMQSKKIRFEDLEQGGKRKKGGDNRMTPYANMESPSSPSSSYNTSSYVDSVISDRDTIPLKHTLSAPAFSNKYVYYRKMSLYDTKTNTEVFNTGFAFSYNDDEQDNDNDQDESTISEATSEEERRKFILRNRHSIFGNASTNTNSKVNPNVTFKY